MNVQSLVVHPEQGSQISFSPTSNRLFLFLGADHRVGTTNIIHSVAVQLATHTRKGVFVLSLSDKPNNDFVEFSRSTIDTLKTSIASKVITFHEIFRESEPTRKYHFLAGPRDMVSVRRYSVEDIIHFLEVLRSQDDYLVLIDGGANLDNPLVIAALGRISNKFMILKNSKSSYKMLDAKMEQVIKPGFGYEYSNFMYILNQFDEDTEKATEIENRKGICVEKFPESKYGSQAEEQEIPLSVLDHEVREKAVNIAKLIATKANCEFHEEEITQSKFKRIFKYITGGERVNGGVPT